MKKYRMWFTNINNGDEFAIEVDNSDEILPALKRNYKYLADPDNWECTDQEEVK